MQKVFKTILALLIFSSTGIALATGRLTLRPIYDTDSHEYRYVLGLPVFHLFGTLPLGYNGWYGAGVSQHPETDWYKVDQEVEMYGKGWLIGVGADYQYTPYTKEELKEVYAKLSLDLW